MRDAFGVHVVEHVAKAHALVADECRRRYDDVVEEELVRLVTDHGADRPDRQTGEPPDVDEEQRHAE